VLLERTPCLKLNISTVHLDTLGTIHDFQCIEAVIVSRTLKHLLQISYISEEYFVLIAIFILSALVIFGVITLFRILKRNKASDEYKRGMDEIRQRFKDYFDGFSILERYYPLGGNVFGIEEENQKKEKQKNEGLKHFINNLNSMSCSIIGVEEEKKRLNFANLAVWLILLRPLTVYYLVY